MADDATNRDRTEVLGEIPTADIRTSQGTRRVRRGSRFWFVTGACLLVALGLVAYSFGTKGLQVTVRFKNGHGIQPGDAVRFRGIDVGKVLAVELDEEFGTVNVRMVLNQAAEGLARQSTRFWIERPLLNATEVRGLDTLVGGRFVGVMPGPAEGPRQLVFDGIESAPTGEAPEGSLEIVLEANDRGGLQRGAPVLYRGLQIGHIISVALSRDATMVQACALVLPPFKELVRDNSVFWETSGIDVSVGLSGLQLSVDTLSTIVLGGVSMATPDVPGEVVSSGYRFVVQKNVDDERMLLWQPQIRIGELAELPHGPLPLLMRAELNWQESTFGILQTRRRQGWVVPCTSGRLLGPASIFQARSKKASPDSVLEMAGCQIDVDLQFLEIQGDLARFELPDGEKEILQEVVSVRFRSPEGPEDCLIVTDTQVSPTPLLVKWTKQMDHLWEIDASVTLSRDWCGAAAIAMSDGCLLGIVIEKDGKYSVAPIPASWEDAVE